MTLCKPRNINNIRKKGDADCATSIRNPLRVSACSIAMLQAFESKKRSQLFIENMTRRHVETRQDLNVIDNEDGDDFPFVLSSPDDVGLPRGRRLSFSSCCSSQSSSQSPRDQLLTKEVELFKATAAAKSFVSPYGRFSMDDPEMYYTPTRITSTSRSRSSSSSSSSYRFVLRRKDVQGKSRPSARTLPPAFPSF